jgi:hypothetical protein
MTWHFFFFFGYTVWLKLDPSQAHILSHIADMLLTDLYIHLYTVPLSGLPDWVPNLCWVTAILP